MLLTIGILFSIWLVVKALIRVIDQYKHFTSVEMEDMRKNRMDKNGKQYSRLIRHLGLCEKCQERLLSSKKDTNIEDHLIERD